MCKFIAERIITCQCTNENPGNSLTKRDFRLQSGNLVYKMRFSFTKRDSWVTNGTLALHFTDNEKLPIVYNVNFGHAMPRCALQYDAVAKVDMKQKKIYVNR